METSELIKKVRKIEIKSKGLSNQIFSGQYHSVFKGRGMAFSEVREYQMGDDVRMIDWNITARSGHPHIKIFEEERELTVILLIDASASSRFGSGAQSKKDLITEISAVISVSALQNNDKIGVIFFTDKVEKFIVPKKGKTHILRVIRELIEFEPQGKGTNVGEAIKYLNNVVKKKSITFVMSDFVAPDFEKEMRIIPKRHDTIMLKVYDDLETQLPNIGLIRMMDSETGEEKIIDTSDPNFRNSFKNKRLLEGLEFEKKLAKNKLDLIKLKTKESYIIPLLNFFKKREGKKSR